MTWYEPYKGGWRARWREPGKKSPPAGPKFPDESAARRWAILSGKDRAEDPLLLDVLHYWAQGRRGEGNVSAFYLREVQDDLGRLFKARGWKRVSDLTYRAITDWRTAVEGVNVKRQLAYLLSVLRWSRKPMNLVLDLDLLLLKLPRQRRQVNTAGLISLQSMATVIAAAQSFGPGVHALIHYLAIYGARPATACSLRIGDVDMAGSMLTVTAKTSGTWQHPLLPETVTLFAACSRGRAPADHLFLAPFTGRGQHAKKESKVPWKLTSHGEANQLGAWYRRNLGAKLLPAKLHGIYEVKRHAITMALRAGLDPATVARFTGHLSLEQVLVYARADEKGAREGLSAIDARRIPQAELAALPPPIDLPPFPPPLFSPR